MTLGQEIEQNRIAANIPVFRICDTLAVSEAGYRKIVQGDVRPTIYQLIMFMGDTRRTLEKA